MSNPSATSSSFIQIPPQSSGKKVATEFRTELYIDNILTDTIVVGSEVVGLTSSASGTITGLELNINGEDMGILFLKGVTGEFVDNEDLQINNITFARVDFRNFPRTDYDIQKVVITDPNNLTYNQSIDRFGATVNTYTDGSPLFGPFGTLMVGEPVTLRDYEFPYGIEAQDFSKKIEGASSIEWERKSVTVKMTTGTNTGDLTQMTSNYYHDYTPGTGTMMEFTCQVGDSGKDGVVRRWGYYDDNNGFFFELNGTDLFVVLRSNSADGTTVTEQRIPQSQWNQDRLDGSNSINFDLDVTKGNIFWIDFQWLGAGRIRYGVIEPSGARLLCHTIENANTNSVYPYSRTGTLPIRWEQFNQSPSASSSELRVACCAVKSTSKVSKIGDLRTADTGVQTVTAAGGTMIVGAIRPALLFKDEHNRTKMRVKGVNFANMSADAFVQFRTHTTLSSALESVGATFVPVSDESSFEIARDLLPHIPEFSRERLTILLEPNKAFDLKEISNDLDPKVELSLYADNATQPVFFITATVLSGTSADVFVAVNWEESKR